MGSSRTEHACNGIESVSFRGSRPNERSQSVAERRRSPVSVVAPIARIMRDFHSKRATRAISAARRRPSDATVARSELRNPRRPRAPRRRPTTMLRERRRRVLRIATVCSKATRLTSETGCNETVGWNRDDWRRMNG